MDAGLAALTINGPIAGSVVCAKQCRLPENATVHISAAAAKDPAKMAWCHSDQLARPGFHRAFSGSGLASARHSHTIRLRDALDMKEARVAPQNFSSAFGQ